MDREEYEKMNVIEDRMWWYFGLHANLQTALLHQITHNAPRILDVGCGTGGFLKKLSEALPSASIVGLDIDETACKAAKLKSGKKVTCSSANSIPFPDNSFDAIVSADVLCHESIDERGALSEFKRCLKPGGALVLNLPAYQFMMSAHDRAVHTARRYSKRRLKPLLLAAGYTSIQLTSWNFILLPLMAGRRLLLPGPSSDVMLFSPPVESLFRGVMRLENFAIERGVSFPFGGSIIVAATT